MPEEDQGPPVYFIDSHCHPPETSEGENRLSDWLQNSKSAGVNEWIAIGTRTSDWLSHSALALQNPKTIHWTAGLHPSYVNENFEKDLSELENILESPPDNLDPCAIGEIGLDFTRIPKPEREIQIDRQKEIYSRQLKIAQKKNLPVVVHSRGTVPECIEILAASGFPAERAIFHCFAEGPETLERIREIGARCSFTGIATFKNAHDVRAALFRYGLDSLILETDSPYLSPEPFRGKPNEPSRIRVIGEFCAKLFGVSAEEVADVTTRNTREFFNLPSKRSE